MSNDVLSLLIEERDRLDRAIAALQGTAPRRGRPPGGGKKAAKKRRRRRMSAAQKEALSKRMKAVWAKRRKKSK